MALINTILFCIVILAMVATLSFARRYDSDEDDNRLMNRRFALRDLLDMIASDQDVYNDSFLI
jgi:hypothetical protein